MRKRLYLTAFLTLILPVFCFAETDYDYSSYLHPWGVFGVVGSGTADTGNNANLILGGGVLFRPYPKAGFEVGARHFNTSEEFNQLPDFYEKMKRDGIMVTASVHYYFSQQRYQPYVLLGGGVMTVRRRNVFMSYDYSENYDRRETSMLLEAGSGVDIYLTNHLSLRPDARLMIGPNGSVQGSINVCYHW